VQYPTFKAICLVRLGRYGEAWASLAREVADDEHPFGRVVRDLGIGFYLVELFDDARAVDALIDVADRGRELHRIWIEDWAEALKGLVLARLGRVSEVNWGRFDVEAPRARVAGANAALATGALDDALSLARSAIAFAAERDAAHETAAAQLTAAQALLGLDRFAEALAVAEEALAPAQEKGYLPLLWQLRAVRWRALAALDRPDEADRERQAAAALVRQLAETIDSPEQRQGFFAYPDVVAVTARPV
jgi:tetratricopeptide (TPR) repeat protein